MLDAGRQIAITYWRKTPHVWVNGYPNKTQCSLCTEEDTRQHKVATPQPPDPTVTVIIDRVNHVLVAKALDAAIPETESKDITFAAVRTAGRGPYSFSMYISCGHGPIGMAMAPEQLPKIGDAYNCWTCESAWHDENFPPLPDDIMAQISALIPHCPTCDAPVAHIPFVTTVDHDVYVEYDGMTGEMDIESDGTSPNYQAPDWEGQTVAIDTNWTTGKIRVDCANMHSWITDKLAYSPGRNEHHWKVVP